MNQAFSRNIQHPFNFSSYDTNRRINKQMVMSMQPGTSMSCPKKSVFAFLIIKEILRLNFVDCA